MSGYILGLDPGNKFTGYCLVDAELRPIRFGKESNGEVMDECVNIITSARFHPITVVIERVASYGMAVGSEVFETCEWIGRFTETLGEHRVNYIYRIEEKQHICHDSRARDANIRRALIDRFAWHDFKNGKGTKNNPDWFYGFSADVWSAYAVAVTFAESRKK